MNSWLFVGPITDMFAICIFCMSTLNAGTSFDHVCSNCFIVVSSLTFNTVWSVFGFILYADMEPQHACSITVLSWSIFQMISALLVCCGMVCWIVFLNDDGGVDADDVDDDEQDMAQAMAQSMREFGRGDEQDMARICDI